MDTNSLQLNQYKVFLFFCPLFIWTQSGAELAFMLDQKPSPKNLKNHLEMTLTNSKGKSRVNRMISKSMDKNNKQMIWFLYPKDDKGVAFLKIEHNANDDEMRMWLPAFKKVRRISAKKRGDSFMGSDLSYEDMTSRQIEDYNFTIIKEDNINNQDCYVMKSEPKKGIKSEYSKHLTWVTKDKYLPVKEESYNRENNLLKVLSIHTLAKALPRISGKYFFTSSLVARCMSSSTKENLEILVFWFRIARSLFFFKGTKAFDFSDDII